MEPELRRRFGKLESANKKVSIEDRRLAREVIDLDARLKKLEASAPEAVKLAKARDRTVTKLYRALVKIARRPDFHRCGSWARAIAKIEAKLAKARPGPAAATRSKATSARLR